MANMDTDLGAQKSPSSTQGGTATETGRTDVRTEAKQAAGEMKHEMQRLKDEARQRGESLLKGQRDAAASEIGGMAEALHKAAQQLNQQEQSTTARYVDRAAEALDKMVYTLREGDLRSMVKKTEDFARRNPGIFFGGSVLVGLMLTRFLKSSAERRETEPAYRSGEGSGTETRYTH
ncbi:uncharacterized protein sS8_4824 [Methylocaldum marinum]|uniref:Uncharacterized protein n=1 Tax=Methylocaldum marinum TaxID=1432792 RepID=A0A250KYR1_9GAMM|nr:hypothetical protein [Methylocaldum marinum]BBA36747.1 uncharacterized protein sS8_4824 [Methylocaldum marinum]